MIRDEDRPTVRAISLQRWAGQFWSGQWEHQMYLAVPTARGGKASPSEVVDEVVDEAVDEAVDGAVEEAVDEPVEEVIEEQEVDVDPDDESESSKSKKK